LALPDRNQKAALMSDALRHAVDAVFDQQVAFLQDIVRFPSRRGEEAPLQDWLARDFARRGYAVDRYTLADVGLAGHEKS